MLIQLGNTKEQEILRKARFSCQKGENYGEFNEGAEKSQGHAVPDAVQHKGESAESVQCCKPHIVYGRGGFDGSHTGERGVHEHEKRCGFFTGQQAESL